MKKVFSLIALVGVFAACQPEDLKTIFESAPAQLTINVTKVINNVDGAEVTGVATKSTFTKTGDPAIAAGVATLTATYNDATGSTDVPYPQILADTDPVVMGCTVYIPGSVNNYKIDVTSKAGEPVSKGRFVLDPTKNHMYNHAGSDWAENASDYVLSDTCTYDEVTGSEFSAATYKDDAFKDMAKAIYEAASKDAKKVTENKTYEFQVPVWTLYKVVSEQFATAVNYYVTATATGGAPTVGETVDGVNNVVATYTETKYTTTIGFEKMEHPGHAGHGAVAGHGNGSNAGGGLVEE